jgi:hypothetical protein
MTIIVIIVIFNFTFQIKSNINYYKNNNLHNTKDNIFNINTFDYRKNNNIHNTNNTIFNSKNI